MSQVTINVTMSGPERCSHVPPSARDLSATKGGIDEHVYTCWGRARTLVRITTMFA